MPPKKSGKTLKPEQIDSFRRWIAEGAEYQGHWSFIKPERPAVPGKSAQFSVPSAQSKQPGLSTAHWALSTNPIDAFVLARLEKERLTPTPEATREILLRRLALDLTGLPPSIAEIDSFIADSTPNAYESAVGRYLNSP